MLKLVTLRARPELRPQLFSEPLQAVWPEFMQHDPTAALYFDRPHLDQYLDTAFAIVDPAEPDIAVGRAFAVPFVFGDLPERMVLPDTGWDGVIHWAHRDRMLGRAANALSALEITLLPEQRGQGASRVILDAMRAHASALGYLRGRAFAVRCVGDLPERMVLPDTGWDGVIHWAHRDRVLGRTANALSALEITLLPEQRGQGASRIILDAMRAHASALGYRYMFAPVRPTAKHLEPFTPIGEYVARRTAEGLPADPWLRVHVRAGGVIVKIAPASMVIPGTIAEWSRWASMAFPASGQIAVGTCLRRSGQRRSTWNRLRRSANTWHAAPPRGCPPIHGCAFTCGRVASSSRLLRRAW